MIRRPPRSTPLYSSAASDVYKRQGELTDLLLKLEDLPVVISGDPEAGCIDLGDVLDLCRGLADVHAANLPQPHDNRAGCDLRGASTTSLSLGPATVARTTGSAALGVCSCPVMDPQVTIAPARVGGS